MFRFAQDHHQGAISRAQLKYISGINLRVVIDAVSVMAAYAAITLTTSILVHWYQICNLDKHYLWLPDDCSMRTETCWNSFYNFNYFNNLRIVQYVCISWTIKCLILLMRGATLKFMNRNSQLLLHHIRSGEMIR